MVNRIRYSGDSFRFMAIPFSQTSFQLSGYQTLLPMRIFKEKYAAIKNKKENSNIYMQDLSDFLYANFPDILLITPQNVNTIQKAWIFSLTPLNLSMLSVCLSIFSGQPCSEREIESYPLTYEICYHNNEFVVVNSNIRLSAYELLSRYIARSLSSMDIPLGDHMLEFKRVNEKNKIELISWKPFLKNWSFDIKATIQYIPFDPLPYLFVHTGIKRWTQSTYTRDNGSKLNGYLKMPVGWNLSGATEEVFASVTLDKKLGWSKYTKALFDGFGFGDLLPPFEDLMKDPISYLDNQNYCSVAIKHGTHIENTHVIPGGAGYIDRITCFNALHDQLTRHFDFISCDPVFRQRVHNRVMNWKDNSIINLPDEVEFEIFYENEDWKQEIINQLEPYLKGAKATISLHSIIDIWGANAFEITTSNQTTAFLQSIQDKLSDTSSLKTMSFIELHGKEHFSKKVDPKAFLRHAFANKNRITQFTTPIEQESGYSHRFESSVTDMLRQIGIIKKNIDLKAILIGVYYTNKHMCNEIKGYKHPIYTAIVDQEVLLYSPSYTQGWVPYREGLIALSKGITIKPITADKQHAALFHAIREIEQSDVPVLVYAAAQNARSQLKQLTNTNVTNGLFFEGKPNWVMIRVRNEDENETPECVQFGRSSEDLEDVTRDLPSSTAGGVIEWSDQVFMSIGTRPSTLKKVPVKESKIDREFDVFPKSSVVELCITNEVPTLSFKQIAHISHTLRNNSIQFDEFTVFPLPLHLAKGAEEYRNEQVDQVINNNTRLLNSR